jgi:predicted transcriptional regulator
MKTKSRIKAITLREKGLSVQIIAKKLSVSKSTVSRWCKNVKLSDVQKLRLENKRRIAGIKALLPWIEKNKKIKIDDIKAQTVQGEKDIGQISAKELYFIGLGLYWGEGYKKGSDEWGFTNSDPAIIRTILQWVAECYQIDITRVHARLTINGLYLKETERITKRWSAETGIPLSKFSSPSIIKGYGKTTRNPKSYRGTLRIKIRNGTSLRRRILASINFLATQISLCSRNTAA